MVKHIIYKEKQYPVRVSYYALKMMAAEIEAENEKRKPENKVELPNATGSGLQDFGFEQQESLLYHALVSGHRAVGETMTLTRNDMEDVLDEVFMDFIKMIPEFFKGKEAPGAEKKEQDVTEKKE